MTPTSSRRGTERNRQNAITLVLEAASSAHDLAYPSENFVLNLAPTAIFSLSAAPPRLESLRCDAARWRRDGLLVSHLQAGAAPVSTMALRTTRTCANAWHEPTVHTCQHASCALMFTCSAADTLHEQQKVGLKEPHPLVQSALKSIEKREFAS